MIESMLGNFINPNQNSLNTNNLMVRRGVIYEIDSMNHENDVRSIIEMIENLRF
jgi:hypothetical protein